MIKFERNIKWVIFKSILVTDVWNNSHHENCLHEIAFRLMSLELTENKSNIGSGALNDLAGLPLGFLPGVAETFPGVAQGVKR